MNVHLKTFCFFVGLFFLQAARNTSCSVNNGGCEQNCTIIDGTVLCTCWHGFQMATDTRKCMDIDECKIFGSCSQGCVNTRGSYKCECNHGYLKAGVDGKHCKAKGGLISSLI